jgi:arylsulfatase A-like enzyme
MSGKLPTEHGIHNECLDWSGPRPTSPANAVKSLSGEWLPETLHARGYSTWAASCNAWVSPWGGFDRGFVEFHDLSDRARLPQGRVTKFARKVGRLYGKVDRGGQAVANAFARRLRASDPRPLFAFANLMEVHAPYNPPKPFYPYPRWRRRSTFKMSGWRLLTYTLGLEEPSQPRVQTLRSLYWHSARYEDWLLAQMVRAIEDRGRPTVVVIVSDHGENIGDHGLFGHNSSLHDTLLHVPLVTWGYRLDVGSGWVEGPVSTAHLARWIRGVADGDTATPLDTGPCISEYESTARRITPELRTRVEAARGAHDLPPLVFSAGLAVHEDGMKYLALETGTEHLYDLSSDPSESTDLSAVRAAELQRFEGHRDAWMARRAAQPTYEVGQVADREIADHLRELGYID